jgi:tryptophan-rich sensory protein
MYDFYESITKPPFSPPGLIYPIAWSILYPLIFITYGICIYKVIEKEGSYLLIGLIIVNLILNFAFTPVFSGIRQFELGSIIAIMLFFSAIWIAYLMLDVSITLATLQLPYIAWLFFACYLSIGVALLN